MMRVIYPLEKTQENGIFLAGPTHRPADVNRISWRVEAVNILEKKGYIGSVYVPEWQNGIKPVDWTYSRQIDWEDESLTEAKIILFWIPREMELLPGLTTNIEFGQWMKSGKIVVGAPPETEKIRYIYEKCSRNKIAWANTLEACVDNAIARLKELSNETCKIWFTADTHFAEQRTLELSMRPFANATEMDWAMIKGWNELVGENDIVYHLGDFGSPSYLKHLKGKQIIFLPGNYDTPEIIQHLLMDKRVSLITNNHETKLDGHLVRLVHEPENMLGINGFFLFGHIHKLQMVKSAGLNVGVDCHNFLPIDIKTVLFYRNAILNHYDSNVFADFPLV